jgi:hypothetical protein
MSFDRPANAPTAGTTSATPHAPAADLSEPAFLKAQQDLAARAITRTLERIGDDLVRSINPAAWTKEHPWASVGAAAVAGFAVASKVVPSKEQQALRKLAALERELYPPPAPPPEGNESSDKPRLGRAVTKLLLAAVNVARPILVSAIAAKFAHSESDNDGHFPVETPGTQPPDAV